MAVKIKVVVFWTIAPYQELLWGGSNAVDILLSTHFNIENGSITISETLVPYNITTRHHNLKKEAARSSETLVFYHIITQRLNMKMEAAWSSETLVSYHITLWRHI
jgi:hypothetical protein